ncbi:DUF222 domain-containing protein [Microbispora rosea]|uniref:DUF222 domain-containing protein n=1 Tax=Microbispora rosea TaxID=58117 RepID=UPI000AEED5D3|nr:DUF222 domain-containing protein [Microbispora rosea]
MDLLDIDPNRSRRSNFSDGWWDRLTADSPLWSADGSSAREHFPIIDLQPPRHTSANTSGGAPGAGSPGSPGAGAVGADAADAGGRPSARSSWVLAGSLRESAQGLALALTPLPEDVDVCLAETEDLLFARDRITCALADRVGRVHAAGRAKQHGHASTRSWLRTAAGMSVAGASRLLTLAVELARLPRVREKFAAGQLAAGVVEAICTATAQLSNEHAGLAEPILLELAGKAGAAEVAKAGRYLRAVLDPDGEDRDERAEYGRRFLRVRPGRTDDPAATADHPADPDHAGSADDPSEADDAVPGTTGDPGHAGGADNPDEPDDLDTAEAEAEANAGAGADGATDSGAESDAGAAGAAHADVRNADRATTGPRDEESRHPGPDERGADEYGTSERGTGRRASRERGAGERRAGECEPRKAASAVSAEGDDTAPLEGDDCDRAVAKTGALDAGRHGSAWPADGGGPSHPAPSNRTPSNTALPDTAPSGTAPAQAAQPDPPPEDSPAPQTHAGHRPARDCRHAQTTSEDHSDVRRGQSRHDRGRHQPDCHEPGREEHGSKEQGREEQDRARQDAADGQGACRCGSSARCSCATQAPGTAGTTGTGQGASPGTPPGAAPGKPGTAGALFGTPPGALLGTALGTAPGLLLATGQMLPVTSVHRLARTSTLVRLVMDAEAD